VRIRKILPAALLLATTAPAHALTFVYNDFSNTSGLSINGDAAVAAVAGRAVLRVTPSQYNKAGSVFGTDAITFGSTYGFSTRFTFNFNQQLGGGADGLVFVIQPLSNSAGGSGGGIGYKGIGNSLGVEYDTYNNGAVDAGSHNHIGVDLNGSIDSVARNTNLPFIMDSSRDLTSWIDYNDATNTLEVRLNDSNVRPLSAILSYQFDLATTVGGPSAFVGFTSGTGGGAANHDLVNWEFRNSFTPIGQSAVPEPAAWMMMIIGFGLMGASLRYRRRALRVDFGSAL
jgi:hypothetical protein